MIANKEGRYGRGDMDVRGMNYGCEGDGLWMRVRRIMDVKATKCPTLLHFVDKLYKR